jgi:hypothetical protein
MRARRYELAFSTAPDADMTFPRWPPTLSLENAADCLKKIGTPRITVIPFFPHCWHGDLLNPRPAAKFAQIKLRKGCWLTNFKVNMLDSLLWRTRFLKELTVSHCSSDDDTVPRVASTPASIARYAFLRSKRCGDTWQEGQTILSAWEREPHMRPR